MNLGGLGLLSKTKKLFIRKYDPKSFWYHHGEKIPPSVYDSGNKLKKKQMISKALIGLFKTLEFKTILEYGCGFEFHTKVVLDNFKVDDFVAFDLSPHRLIEAKIVCKNYSVDFQTSTIEDFKTDTKFDLVFSVGVLNHVRPEHIEPIIKKLMGFAKKDFVFANQPFDPNYKIERTTHSYRHNYKQIFQELGYDVKIITIPPQPLKQNGVTKPYHHTNKLFHVQLNAKSVKN